MDVDVFVQNAKYYCRIKGVSPTVACAESGAGKDLLSQLTKRGSVPSVAKVQLLAQYLGVTTSDLLGEETQSSPPSKEDRLQAALAELSADEREDVYRYVDLVKARRKR